MAQMVDLLKFAVLGDLNVGEGPTGEGVNPSPIQPVTGVRNVAYISVSYIRQT
jgi:hypothetical protein